MSGPAGGVGVVDDVAVAVLSLGALTDQILAIA